MPLTKKQWLNQTVMCDEWGRDPSLADVPLMYMPRKKALEKRGYSKKQITEIYKTHIKVNKTSE
jgi:hypothetical protein